MGSRRAVPESTVRMHRTILIVEDDENDRLFESLAFADIGLAESLRFAIDGQQAIDYLQGVGKLLDRALFPLPSLILLDLNLPVLSGLTVLRWIRSRPQFQSTIVIPLTSSNNPIDIESTRDAGANDYIVKPVRLREWRALVHRIQRSWLRPHGDRTPAWGTLACVAG
jgi:CheY-like chemotaxis protein